LLYYFYRISAKLESEKSNLQQNNERQKVKFKSKFLKFVGHEAPLATWSHMNGLIPFDRTIEKAAETMSLTQKQ